MKTLLLALTIALSTSAMATGGFYCKGKIKDGSKITVGGCLSWNLGGGICNDVKVYVDDELKISIPRENLITDHYGPKIFALTMAKTANSQRYDSDLLLRVEYDRKFLGSKKLEYVNDKNELQKVNIKCEFE